MGRLTLAILCLFVATGTVLFTQPKAQKRQSTSHKKAQVKSQPVRLREIALRYGDEAVLKIPHRNAKGRGGLPSELAKWDSFHWLPHRNLDHSEGSV